MARIAVVGAGAAGISAGRSLLAAGHEVVVYEARDRIGGRAHTNYGFAGHPVELGAEFIHGENVTTWDWVREFGAATSGDAHAYEMFFHLEGQLLDRTAARAEYGTNPLLAIEKLRQSWIGQGNPETSLDRVLELWPELIDRPLSDEGRRLLANIFAELTASDLDQLSTHHPEDPAPGLPNLLQHFRLAEGYTKLLQKATLELDIRLESPVTAIHWDEHGAEIESGDSRERYESAVVTLPIGVLRREIPSFSPALPAAKLDAIGRINPGHISKILLRFDRVLWPPEVTFIFTALSTQLWWRSGQGQANEQPVLTAFFGGSDAAALESASEQEAVAEGLRQLEDILGASLTSHLVAGRYVAWGAEPYTWMGYSSLPPNGHGLREALGEPVGALHFAGEATSLYKASTIHGAIESGHRAAAEVIAAVAEPGTVHA